MEQDEDNGGVVVGAIQKLGRRLSSAPQDNICLWSDLLGFGRVFLKNNWRLSDDEWEAVRERLFLAHSSAIWNFPLSGNILILNDGIAVTSIISHDTGPVKENKCAKIFDLNGEFIDTLPPANALLQLSLFIQNAVQTHITINMAEKERAYPGTRSVITFGQCAPYIAPEIKKDDFSLRSKSGGESSGGSVNPTIVFNPYSLQMNTAFLKAYIIESAGSDGGVSGSNLYIDESVLESIRRYADDLGREYVVQEIDDYIEIRVLRVGSDYNNVILGFRLSKPIEVKKIRFAAKVYRLFRFYPFDELADEFWFDLAPEDE